jgi:Ca-activated chloride channel family protein
MHEKENKIRSAIEGLNKIKTYFGDANDEAFLCLFKGSLIMSDFTHNIPALNILFETDKPIGGTAFYDAVYAGIKKLKEEGKNTTKVLVIISDGQDNNSRRTFKEIRDLARETGVIIYAIGTFDMNDQFGREGRAILQDLVDMTGGRLFESTSIENACSQIASEAKCAYSIGFYPSDTPQVANTKKKESIVHKIKIKLVNLINLGLPSSIYKNLKHREREYYIGKD